jgi:hypothetical protein
MPDMEDKPEGSLSQKTHSAEKNLIVIADFL